MAAKIYDANLKEQQMKYYTLKITDDLPEGFAGTATAWFIKIRPAYKDDIGLLEHEKTHCRQFWRTLGFHVFLYGHLDSYTLKCEVEAYREQLCWPPATSHIVQSRQRYAEFLASKYGLKITVEEALRLLS